MIVPYCADNITASLLHACIYYSLHIIVMYIVRYDDAVYIRMLHIVVHYAAVDSVCTCIMTPT